MPRKKPHKYEIADLLSEYNRDLYNEVSSKIDIDLVKDIKLGWSASIDGDKAIITYKKVESPDACLAHELLHIKYELNGLKAPLTKDEEGVTDIVPFLFNQLCHFKFYNEFYELGFNEEEFLNEQDETEKEQLAKRDINTLEQIYEKSGEIKGSTALLLPYIVLKSPHDISETTKGYINRLKKIGEANFFETIDKIIDEWVNSESLDSSYTFARLFKACNRPKVGFCLSGKEEDVIISGNI
jgi:hypothetical protein